MKHVLAVLFILTIVISSKAQENINATGPMIEFEKISHDFGTILENKYAKYKFKFYNKGDKPLVLKNVRPSCGCTASDWPREPIMPGDSSTITATFNSRGYGGRSFHKSITVTSNMLKNHTKVLYIKGFVKKKEEPPKDPESPVRINND